MTHSCFGNHRSQCEQESTDVTVSVTCLLALVLFLPFLTLLCITRSYIYLVPSFWLLCRFSQWEAQAEAWRGGVARLFSPPFFLRCLTCMHPGILAPSRQP